MDERAFRIHDPSSCSARVSLRTDRAGGDYDQECPLPPRTPKGLTRALPLTWSLGSPIYVARIPPTPLASRQRLPQLNNLHTFGCGAEGVKVAQSFCHRADPFDRLKAGFFAG